MTQRTSTTALDPRRRSHRPSSRCCAATLCHRRVAPDVPSCQQCRVFGSLLCSRFRSSVRRSLLEHYIFPPFARAVTREHHRRAAGDHGPRRPRAGGGLTLHVGGDGTFIAAGGSTPTSALRQHEATSMLP